ncbi:MAG: phage tail tape measure protein, partial [Eggerthellaceae bacterium]|nr:phage tail tape measure protein [Eggerthellaceae bacterium]
AVETLTRLTAQLGNADAAAKALPATLTLAKAAQIDFNESADLVATTLKAFSLNADQAGQVADKPAAIAARTGVNLADLARGAAEVAPLAKQAGIGFDTVASALAELSSTGFDAQKSRAGLRELFVALGTPTSKLRQDLVGLGIDTTSLNSIMDGLRGAGDRGTKALEDLSVNGRAAVLALEQGGGAVLQQFQKILDDSAGSASKTAKLLGDTLDGALKGIGRTVDSLAEDMVKESLPAVEGELKKLNEELKDVGKSETFKTLKDGVKDFVTDAVKWFDQFAHAIAWKDFGKQISEWANSARESFALISESVGVVGKGFGILGNIVGAVWNTIKTVFDSIASATSYLASHVVESLASALDKIGYFSDAAAQKAKEFHDLAKQYADNATAYWNAGDEAAEKVGKSLGDLTEKILDAGEKAKDAAPKHEEHAKSLKDSAEQSEHAAAASKLVGDAISKTADSAQASTSRIRGFQASLNEAVTALGVLEHAGITTGPAVQALRDQIQSASAQLRSFGNDAISGVVNPSLLGMKASVAAGSEEFKKIQAAAAGLKITLQGDLAEAADTAANHFKLIEATSDGSAAGIANVRNAFLDYARKQLEATQNLTEGERYSTQAMLESKAAALGLTNILQGLIDASNKSGIAAREAAGNYLEGVRQAQEGAKLQQDQMAEGAKRAAECDAALAKLKDTTASLADREKALAAAMDSASDATERQAATAEGAETEMVGAMGAAQSLGQIMANTGAQFSAVSEAAGHEFTAALDHALTSIGLVKEGTTDLTKSMGDLRNAVDTGSGIVSYFKTLEAVQEQTQAKIDGQRESLAATISLLNTYGTAAQTNFGIAGQGADKLLSALLAQRQALQDGNSGFTLLGQQELGPLQQALDSAIQRTQQLADAAKAAEQQYESLAQGIHDSLLQEQGNQTALEDERHQKQLADLKAAAEAANTLNSQSYQQAVQEENQLHELKMQNLQKQAQAAANSSSSTGAGSSSGSTSSSSGDSGASSSQSSGSAGSSGTVSRIEITLNGNNLGGINLNDPRDQQRILDVVMNGLRNAQRSA